MDDRLHSVVTAVTSGIVGVTIAVLAYGGSAPEGSVGPTGPTTTLAPASTGSSTHTSVPLIDAFAG